MVISSILLCSDEPVAPSDDDGDASYEIEEDQSPPEPIQLPPDPDSIKHGNCTACNLTAIPSCVESFVRIGSLINTYLGSSGNIDM